VGSLLLKIDLNINRIYLYQLKMHRGFTYYIRDKTNPDLIYYGSSELPTVDDRIKSHLYHFNYWKKDKDNGYCSSFKVLEKDNYEYDTIDVVYFDTTYELRQHERPLIEGQICVNIQIPNRTTAEWRKANPNHHAEWYQKNKEQHLKQKKEWYQKNKEQILKQTAEWYQKNKEQKSKQNADYYQKNKEQILKQIAEYKQNNKEKISTKNKEKFNCECGGLYTYQNTSRHIKSKKHQKWVQSQITET
jgi:selenocysteine-specific translation elongation factor